MVFYSTWGNRMALTETRKMPWSGMAKGAVTAAVGGLLVAAVSAAWTWSQQEVSYASQVPGVVRRVDEHEHRIQSLESASGDLREFLRENLRVLHRLERGPR